jgi:hypothetical protein
MLLVAMMLLQLLLFLDAEGLRLLAWKNRFYAFPNKLKFCLRVSLHPIVMAQLIHAEYNRIGFQRIHAPSMPRERS